MRVGICYKQNMDHQTTLAKQVAKGFIVHGIETELIPNTPTKKYDLLVCWGERWRLNIKDKATNVLVAERAYFQDRFEWVSLGFNGLNGRADFLNKNSPSDRWLKYFNDGRMKEWSSGDYILLTLQIPGDASLTGTNITYPEIIKNLRKYSEYPIKIRMHPSRPNRLSISEERNVSFSDFNTPIEVEAEKAKVVVTISSNSGVDATLAGTPVLNFNNHSMVWDLAMKDYKQIDNPPFPDRIQWAYDVSYAQWLPSEIESGDAWEHLKRKYE